MKIRKFNREEGVYQFELNEINTTFHAHPATEIIFSKNGSIELETPKFKSTNISFAIIEANTPHRIKSEEDTIALLMLECQSKHLENILLNFEIKLFEGLYYEQNTIDRLELIDHISNAHPLSKAPVSTNENIQICLDYLDSGLSEYKGMKKELTSRTQLSNSRLSHLFKEEMGISIKKYLVWSRLTKAFEIVLSKKKNMYEAALQCGFYDQAHLSKAFKQMLGINPSKVYNSRILQV